MNEIVLSTKHVETLRNQLLQADGNERFAYLYCSPAGDRLVTTQVHVIADDEMATLQRTACRPDPATERRHVAACLQQDMIPVMVHSHPFSDDPSFSGLDHTLMEDHMDWINGLYPDATVGFIVLGTQNMEARCYTPDPNAMAVDVVGNWKLDTTVGDPANTTETVDRERYDRNTRLFTEQGQAALQDTTVAVVGVGGLGNMAAVELARLGIGTLTLVDPDTVERSNLPRLLGATEGDIGEHKVDVLHHRVFQANPDVDITAVSTTVEATPNALADADVILGCVDQVSARLYLNEYAVKYLTPYIDAGTRIDTTDGQVNGMNAYLQTIAPGATACFDCLNRWNPETVRREQLSTTERKQELRRGYIDEDDLEPEPAVIHLNGTAASLAVATVAKLVTKYEQPPDFLRYDGLDNEVTEITTTPTDQCITCGRMLGRTQQPAQHFTSLQDSFQEADLAW